MAGTYLRRGRAVPAAAAPAPSPVRQQNEEKFPRDFSAEGCCECAVWGVVQAHLSAQQANTQVVHVLGANISVHECTNVQARVCLCSSVCMHMQMCVYRCTRARASLCAHNCLCTHLHLHACTRTCMHLHTHAPAHVSVHADAHAWPPTGTVAPLPSLAVP